MNEEQMQELRELAKEYAVSELWLLAVSPTGIFIFLIKSSMGLMAFSSFVKEAESIFPKIIMGDWAPEDIYPQLILEHSECIYRAEDEA